MDESTKPEGDIIRPEGDIIRNVAQTESVSRQMEKVRKAELWISSVLRIGVITALVVVTIGVIVAFVSKPSVYLHTNAANRFDLTRGSGYPHSLSGVFGGLAHFQGDAIIVLGLMILLATPILRVLVSAIIFSIQRDRYFVPITVFVLIMLLTSFILGKSGG